LRVEKEKLIEETTSEKEKLLRELILLRQKLKESSREEIVSSNEGVETEIEKSKVKIDLQSPHDQDAPMDKPHAEQQTSASLNPDAAEFVPSFVITPPGIPNKSSSET